MIQTFVDEFMENQNSLREQYAQNAPDSYTAIVRDVLEICAKSADYDVPDVDRITVIDHGDYQGTKLYIVGAKGYQPSTYWAVFVHYGSCSGCDTYQSIRNYRYDGVPTEKEVDGYMTLALHIVQNIREV